MIGYRCYATACSVFLARHGEFLSFLPAKHPVMDGHGRANATDPSTIHEVICARLQSIICGNFNDIVKMSWTRKKDMDGHVRDKTTWTGLPAENTTWTGLPAEERHGRTCPQKNDMDGLARRKTTWTSLYF